MTNTTFVHGQGWQGELHQYGIHAYIEGIADGHEFSYVFSTGRSFLSILDDTMTIECVSHVDPVDALCDALDTFRSFQADFPLPPEVPTLPVPYKASWRPSQAITLVPDNDLDAFRDALDTIRRLSLPDNDHLQEAA